MDLVHGNCMCCCVDAAWDECFSHDALALAAWPGIGRSGVICNLSISVIVICAKVICDM